MCLCNMLIKIIHYYVYHVKSRMLKILLRNFLQVLKSEKMKQVGLNMKYVLLEILKQ